MSVSEWSSFKGQCTIEAFYERLRAIGYMAIEMPAPAHLASARAAGLDVLNLTVPGELNRLDQHESAMATLRETLPLAREHGVKQLIVFSGNRSEGQSESTGHANVVTFLRAAAPLAEAAGVVLTLEVLNKFDHPGYEADRSAYAFEAARAVAWPSVKVLYDVYHMHRMGEDVAATLAANVSLVAHVHIAGNPGRGYPGPSQEIDYRDVVARALAAGYRGHWGMEFLSACNELAELEAAHALFRTYA